MRDKNSLDNRLGLPDPSAGVAGPFEIDPLPLSDCGIDGANKESVGDEDERAVRDVRGGQAGCADADGFPGFLSA